MGAVVLSIDAELAWGFHDAPSMPDDRLANARGSWRDVLALLDRYEVPATWAVVGHLMLDACDGRHEAHAAPDGWFDRDPGGSRREAGDWFAPELVRAVRQATPDHEIASHTFSHLPFGRSDVDARMVDVELERHRSIADDWEISLESFVFPRNDVAHRDRVAANGFTCYRGRQPDEWYDGSPLRRPGKALDLVTGGTGPPVVRPTIDAHGIVNIPASLDLFGFEGVARRVFEPITGDPIVEAARRGIAAAADGPGVFHGWLHPNNVTNRADLDRLEAVLACIERHDVPVRTMGAIATDRRHAPYV